MVAVAEDADAELARRQYKAIRTSLLCVKARALARLGRHADAAAALAGAVRSCPRGAVDPLIVLEASRALCATLKGDVTNGVVHYDRAIAACRAIGHRYHEWWIAAQRDDVLAHTREAVAVAIAATGHHADVTAPERCRHDSRRRSFSRPARASGVGHPAEHDAGAIACTS